MARITVEDCIKKLNNRFELVVLASARTREIWKGNETYVERENDKPPIIALREIADTDLDFGKLRQQIVTALQRVTLREEISDKEVREVLAEESNRGGKDSKSAARDIAEMGEGAQIFEDADIGKLED
ncbi:MAG: DNA-directed RNA polymerase subunit omega [Hydrotalea sp.]|nr:DNA-directed RNA polymerase subunit omega [Hydrotalea sp.]